MLHQHIYQGSLFRGPVAPVANLERPKPSADFQREKLDPLGKLDQSALGRLGHDDKVEAAIANYDRSVRTISWRSGRPFVIPPGRGTRHGPGTAGMAGAVLSDWEGEFMYLRTRSPRRPRAGAAVVEFAVVAPLLFLLILGIIEFGRALMVQEIVTNAAREGARRAVLPGSTRAEVEKLVQDYLDANLISGHAVQTTDPAAAQAGAPLTVTVTVPYAQVSWLPAEAVRWASGKVLTGTAVMRKEKQNN